ncbi:ABC-three component system middle component 5 [Rhizobium leguminosarum]|uniref:ABC-three component system middle component 5 n=1 Tax=Rhizobium leguminosarum TaxID=384 RepID=UPI0039656E5D
MLVYHPAFDVYHGVFRALLLLEHTPRRSMPAGTLRIVDLYFVFPYLLATLDFPRGTGAQGRKLAALPSRFNNLPSPRTFLAQSEGLHRLITSGLAGKGLISDDSLQEGYIERTPIQVPNEILEKADNRDVELAKYLGTNIATIPLLGKRGLKDRSKLMEFRYDPV